SRTAPWTFALSALSEVRVAYHAAGSARGCDALPDDRRRAALGDRSARRFGAPRSARLGVPRANGGVDVVGSEAAAAADDLHARGDPRAAETLEPLWRDHVDEAPVGHLEVAGVGIGHQRPREAPPHLPERIGYDIGARMHDPGGVYAGARAEVDGCLQRTSFALIVAE